MPKFSPDEVEILWTCEECAPRVDKIMNFKKSERISFREDRAVEVRRNWRRRLNQYSFSASERRPANMKDRISKTAHETGDHSLPGEETKRDQSFGETIGNQELKNQRRKLILEDEGEGDSHEQFDYVESLGNQDLRKRRRLILEDEGDCDEQLDSVEVNSSPLAPSVQSNTSYSQSSLESDNYNYYAKPVIDSIWKYEFSLSCYTSLICHLALPIIRAH